MNIQRIVKTCCQGFQGLDAIVNPINESKDSTKIATNISKTSQEIINVLWQIEGITQANSQQFLKATPFVMLRDKLVLKIHQNPLKVTHIFLANHSGQVAEKALTSSYHSKTALIIIILMLALTY